jgi:hypothetical protein
MPSLGLGELSNAMDRSKVHAADGSGEFLRLDPCQFDVSRCPAQGNLKMEGCAAHVPKCPQMSLFLINLSYYCCNPLKTLFCKRLGDVPLPDFWLFLDLSGTLASKITSD